VGFFLTGFWGFGETIKEGRRIKEVGGGAISLSKAKRSEELQKVFQRLKSTLGI
jgi:hypothetical protein